jgi:hypothetical protein
VSWCPLGWNNRPVFSFVNVNIFGGRRYDPWHAWTVVPHRGFGRGFVNVNVINASRLDIEARRAFVVRETQPDFRGYAVPRSSAPIRTAVSREGAFGTEAFRSSLRTNPATGSAVQGAADPATAFRSRRSGSAPLTGPGYPQAARPPDRTAPTRERGVPSTTSPERVGGFRSRETAPSSSSDPGSAAERRAVPRSAPPNTAPAPDAGVQTPTYRRSAPEYRVSPSPGAGVPETSPDRIPDGYRRAVPRSSDSYSPPPSYGGVQRERNAPSGGADDRQRAVPRSNPYSPPPDRGDSSGYRPRGGIERSAPAPSGPPPSAAPRGGERSAPSEAGQGGGDRGGGTRSRGDGQSSGRAVPRGRGGR